MKIELTKKVAVIVPRELDVVAVIDEDADFNQIIVRLRKGSLKMDFRIVKLGDEIELETWKGSSIEDRKRVPNKEEWSEAINEDIATFFA